jgi:two-component system, sensor histidine kinase and response regulator
MSKAAAVQTAAGRLEQASHDGAAAAMTARLVEALGGCLAPLISDLSSAPGAPSAIPVAAPTVDPAEARPVAETMRRLLGDSDTLAIACLEDHRAVFAWLLGDGLPAFIRQLQDYAFDDALATLQAAIRDRGL